MKIHPLVVVLLLLPSSFPYAHSLSFAQTKPVKVPGTKVSIVPPDNLKPSAQFPGFGDEETSSSIMVTELPAPYSEFAKGFTKEALAAKGLNLLSQKKISINGRPGILMNARQETLLITVLKWIVVTGNEKETVLVTATFPEEMKAKLSSAMEKSALSLQWDADAETDPLAGLNFSFDGDPSLKVATRLTNMALLTRGGDLPGKQASGPLFIIGSSFSQIAISDPQKFAEARLMTIEQVSEVAIKKQSDVAIAGLQGSEIVAEAKWKDMPDATVVIYQVLLLDEKNYFIMQGIAPREEREKYLAVFSRIAQSFRKK